MLTSEKRGSFFWKFTEYIFYVYVALFPFVNFRTFLYGGSSTRAVTLILLAIILGIGFAFYLFKKNNALSVPKSPIFISILLYFIFLVISGIVGINFQTSFWSAITRTTGIWYFFHLGFVIYMIWALVAGNMVRQNKIILMVIVSTAIFSVLSFLSPEGVNLLFQDFEASAFTFGNTTFAAMYILGALLLSLYYLLQLEKKKWWMYALPVSIIVSPSIISRHIWYGDFSQGIIGEARASSYVILLSLVLLTVIWLVSKIKDKKFRSISAYSIFSLSVIMMAVSAFLLFSPEGYLRKVYLSQATAVRPLVWEMSAKVIAQKPFFGWGSDNFERVFEKNYDNRILQDEYGNEAWLDRAHNIFIDQSVDNGFVGLVFYILIYLIVVLSLIYVTLNSTDRKDRVFASILIVYFSLHLVELQTAFDTTISYFMLAIMLAFSVSLFDRTRRQITGKNNEIDIANWTKYAVASILLVFFSWSFIKGWIPFVRAQVANGHIRTAGSSEKRLSAYPTLFSSPIDRHSFLWRTSTDFQKSIGANPKVIEDPQKMSLLKKEIIVFENEYRKVIEDNPDHFRARLNLADMLIYQRLFGVDKLNEAQEALDEAIILVPQAPQSYWMKAVAYVYMKKFELAREYAKRGLELNPSIKQSQDVVDYVEKSIRDFPEIDLYFFKQI